MEQTEKAEASSRWPDFKGLLPDGIDPQTTVVMRHAPQEAHLRRALPSLADEYPDQFNAYQSVQGEKVARDLKHARHLASFIGHKPRHALFVGIYEIVASRKVTRDVWHTQPGVREILELGGPDLQDGDTLFDLAITDHLKAWKGRLAVEWPRPEIKWWRWAGPAKMPLVAIHEESVLTSALPRWDELDLTIADLKVMPARLRSAMAQWRAIYYVFDTATRRGYVGSAYGSENLLQRWEYWARTVHGGNVLPREALQQGELDPENLRFTILQRVSPDMDLEAVVALENSWKVRLHARSPYGYNDN